MSIVPPTYGLGPAQSSSQHRVPPAPGKAAPTTSFAQALALASQASPAAAKPQGAASPKSTTGNPSLDEMTCERDEAVTSLNVRVRERLSEAGITLSKPLTMAIEPSTGKAVVQGDNPDKERIEALFEQYQDLRDSLSKIVSFSAYLQRGRETLAYQAAYRMNPDAAMMQYAKLLSGTFDDAFAVTFDNDAESQSARVEREQRNAKRVA